MSAVTLLSPLLQRADLARQTRIWLWISATLLCLLIGASRAQAMDAQTQASLAELGAAMSPPSANPSNRLSQALGLVIYRLWVATRLDFSPERALTLAAQKNGHPLDGALRLQLLADWRLASTYGLLTPENLARLRAGQAPIATDGPFVGQTVGAATLRPGLPARLENLAFTAPDGSVPPEAQPSTVRSTSARFIPTPLVVPTSRQSPWQDGDAVIVVVPRGAPAASPTFYGGQPPSDPHLPGAGSAAIQASQVEVHDVAFNDSLPLGGTRRLAVASDSGSVLSVSIIGEGPKIWRPAPNEPSGGDYYPRVNNSKVPKVNPIRLPRISGNAYLIHSEAQGRYYFIDVSVSNGSFFRIAKVWGGGY